MRKIFLMIALLSLSACVQKQQASADSAQSEQQVAVSSIASSVNQGSPIRQNFTSACVQSAVGDKPASVAKTEFAKNVCSCVYEQGILAYGGQAQWENAIKDFDKNLNDPKLNQISHDAIEVCVVKYHTPNQAAASAAK